MTRRFVDPRSAWLRYFGHMIEANAGRDFKPRNFPLEIDPGDEAEELSLGDEYRTDREALTEIERIGRVPASLAAQGRYLLENPAIPFAISLKGIGAQARIDGWTRFPSFCYEKRCLIVHLNTLEADNVKSGPYARYLVQKR